MLSRVASLLVAASAVSAHFTLDYPPSRGFDEDIEPQFCGGFPSVGNRSLYPLAGGPISIDSHHPTSQSIVVISFDNAPANFSQFNTTSNGTSYPYLVPDWSLTSEGSFCITTNISALNVPGVVNGTNATIQVVFNGGDGTLYQCADVTLVTDFTPSNVTCTNGTSPTTTTAAAGAAATTSAASGVAAAPAATSATGGASFGVQVSGLIALVAAAGMALVL